MPRNRRCESAARILSCAGHDLRQGLAAGKSRIELMPMPDAVFAVFPAPQDFALVESSVEIDQAFVEALELAAHLVQLTEIAVDLPGYRIDVRLQVQLLFRLSPLGARLRGDQLVLRHEILPLGIHTHDVLHDSPHERKRAVGLSQRKELMHTGLTR